MRKFLSLFLSLILIFLLTGCNPSDAAVTTSPSQSDGGEVLKEPPQLTVICGADQITALTGTTSWTYQNTNGTSSGFVADSMHPLQTQNWLTPLETTEAAAELFFTCQPDELTVRCWSDACWNDVDAPDEAVEADGFQIILKPGGYIYEVTGKWTSIEEFGGTVHYIFYTVLDDQVHTAITEPTVSGCYCGNTITTVHLNGQDYTFSGTDSVTLTDILRSLDYDPQKICRCMPEFTVDTEFASGYGINLTESYARTSSGQADLTEDQAAQIREILERLNK